MSRFCTTSLYSRFIVASEIKDTHTGQTLPTEKSVEVIHFIVNELARRELVSLLLSV